MKTLAAILAAAALAAPAATRAQPVSYLSGPGPDTYLEFHLGGFLPQDDIEELDPNVAFGGTFGARFNPHLSVEGGIEYLRARAEEGGEEIVLSDLPLTASFRLRAPLKVAEISALAGVGIHLARLSFESPFGDASDTATAFGFHVGAAVAFNLSPTMTFGVDVRRTFVEPSFDGGDLQIGGVRLALTLAYHL